LDHCYRCRAHELTLDMGGKYGILSPRETRNPSQQTMRTLFFRLLVAGLLACVLPFSSTAMANTAYPAIDLVVVVKSARTLYLYSNDTLIRSYPIGLGYQPLGTKRQSGDEKTPEGVYVLDWRNPDSSYYR